MDIVPGIYPDLTNKEYHSHAKSYGKTNLTDFSIYPYYMIYRRLHRERKAVFDLGTAAHAAILEPERFEETVAVIPDELLGKNGARSTKACKQWIAEQPEEKAILTTEERESVLRIRDSVLENPAHSEARKYLTGGISEASCFWHEYFEGEQWDEQSGCFAMTSNQYGIKGEDGHSLLMKCRPDHIPAEEWIADLKTTGLPIDEITFSKTAHNHFYHWSAALTLRGMQQATGKTHRNYVFVVVETKPPFEVAVYRANRDFRLLGLVEVMRTLQRLAYCDRNQYWPGMPNKTQPIGPPVWALRKL